MHRCIRMYSAVIALVLLAIPWSAQAIEKDVARCASISGDLERLECYDDLARSLGLDRPQPVAVAVDDTGDWDVRHSINPIDDTETVVLTLDAASGRSGWGDPVRLVLRCQSHRTEAYVDWNTYLGREVNVVYRIGTAPAEQSRWNMSTDNQASFYPGNVQDFIKRLSAVDRFVAQTIPYGENPVTAIFDIAGLKNALIPLREACAW